MLETFQYQFVKTFIEKDRYLIFIDGFRRTLTIAFFATLIGIALGVLAAVVKVYHYRTGKLKPLCMFVDAYLTVFRGTPVVVQLMILYYVLFTNIQSGLVVAVIGFGINSGAYVAEIVRAGILSIDKGQTEAGRSLGLTEAQTMYYVVLPQALKNALPALFNEFIMLLKETSIAGYITVVDLTKAGDLVRSKTMLPFFPLISVAVIYLILVIGLTRVQNSLEERLRRSDRK